MEWPKITKDTPLEEIKAIHQRIWDYAIEHGEKPKTPYIANCVACEHDDLSTHGIGQCYFCPIAWPNESICMVYYSLYRQWAKEKDPIKKAELARQIRDLPFKYEMES